MLSPDEAVNRLKEAGIPCWLLQLPPDEGTIVCRFRCEHKGVRYYHVQLVNHYWGVGFNYAQVDIIGRVSHDFQDVIDAIHHYNRMRTELHQHDDLIMETMFSLQLHGFIVEISSPTSWVGFPNLDKSQTEWNPDNVMRNHKRRYTIMFNKDRYMDTKRPFTMQINGENWVIHFEQDQSTMTLPIANVEDVVAKIVEFTNRESP